MKETYKKPIVNILYLAETDVLLSSGEGNNDNDGYMDDFIQ